MALPDIQNWFTPEEDDEQAPEWRVGRIYYDGQEYSPDEVDAFAVELGKLAAKARARVIDPSEQLMDLLTSAAQLGFASDEGTKAKLRVQIEDAMSWRIKRYQGTTDADQGK